jgi:3-hexulose-6-phosphate synthase
MRLQLAMDLVDTEGCLKLAGELQDVIDIAEIGTPVIILEGVKAVAAMRKKFPKMCLLADTKIADGASIEAGYAVDSGADIITVLAVSDDLTIKGTIDVAHQAGKQVLVDLINVKDVVKRSRQLDEMGADYLCVHTASDVQATGRNPIEELYAIKSIVKKSKLACAGGINMKTINEIAAAKPEIIIIGTGITKAENPYQTAKAFHDIIARQ